MKQRGFTVIELIAVIVFVVVVGSIFFVQKRELTIAARDSTRKTAINAMHYSLEEAYFPVHKSYPSTIDATKLPSVDPVLFKDSNGKAIGNQASTYRYEPTGCNGDVCTGYILRADLENEADYVKGSKN